MIFECSICGGILFYDQETAGSNAVTFRCSDCKVTKNIESGLAGFTHSDDGQRIDFFVEDGDLMINSEDRTEIPNIETLVITIKME